MKTFIRILLCCLMMNSMIYGQLNKSYPPNTKWYQDPLGISPLELSTAAGFAWGSVAVAACFLFTKKEPGFKNKIFFYQESGMGKAYKVPYTATLQTNTGLMFMVRKWMAVGIETNLLYFSDGTNHTTTFGTRPFARWYPVTGKKMRVFFEYGAGVSVSTTRFPFEVRLEGAMAKAGTKFNFTTKYGIGSEMIIGKNFRLQAGLRHFHLSNGNIKGIPRNPTYDSNGLFAGILIPIVRS